ncbi:hypothetical protein J1N35_014752 [Gossypium stocksii]|uniref:CCHC-type domain-containing protein n=1 Tax=Gossypium stocksii TaxID=47602 RepID=A0A9D3VX41_9ROSI|nr:hypothetical protein J1N35_014752 [Gossypium stocksii]
MLKLMGFFTEVEDNGAELDMNMQIEITFKSLTKEFASFRAIYNLGNKKAKGKKKPNKPSVPPHVDKKKAKKSKDPKKIKCFFCNKKGHSKSNFNEYLGYLAEKGKCIELFVVEACLVEESIGNWVIDSRATNHVYDSL